MLHFPTAREPRPRLASRAVFSFQPNFSSIRLFGNSDQFQLLILLSDVQSVIPCLEFVLPPSAKQVCQENCLERYLPSRGTRHKVH